MEENRNFPRIFLLVASLCIRTCRLQPPRTASTTWSSTTFTPYQTWTTLTPPTDHPTVVTHFPPMKGLPDSTTGQETNLTATPPGHNQELSDSAGNINYPGTPTSPSTAPPTNTTILQERVCATGSCTEENCLRHITTTCPLEEGNFCYQVHVYNNVAFELRLYEVGCRDSCQPMTQMTSSGAGNVTVTIATKCCQTYLCNKVLSDDGPIRRTVSSSERLVASVVAMATGWLLMFYQCEL